MKVIAQIKYFYQNDKDKIVEIQNYDTLKVATHFQFEIYRVKEDLINFAGINMKDTNNVELLNKSNLLEIKKDTKYGHKFGGFGWIYNSNAEEIYIVNRIIEI